MSLHPIIEISELTQLVADRLLTISPGSLVLLACTCRALKEQALSTLWSEQRSLKILVEATSPSEIPSPSQPLPHVCVLTTLIQIVFLLMRSVHEDGMGQAPTVCVLDAPARVRAILHHSRRGFSHAIGRLTKRSFVSRAAGAELDDLSRDPTFLSPLPLPPLDAPYTHVLAIWGRNIG